MKRKLICIFLTTIISISLLSCGKAISKTETPKKEETAVSQSSDENASENALENTQGTAASDNSTQDTAASNSSTQDNAASNSSTQGTSGQSESQPGSTASNNTAKNSTTKPAAPKPGNTAAKTNTGSSTSKPASDDPIMALGKLEFSLKDIEGDTYNSNDVFKENKLTLMNIWGTMCTPCIKELPELQKLSNELSSKGIGVIGLVGDVNGDDGLDEAKLIVTKKKINFLNLLPNDKIRDELLSKIKGYPVTIFLDSEGNIVGQVIVGARSADEYKSTALEILETLK